MFAVQQMPYSPILNPFDCYWISKNNEVIQVIACRELTGYCEKTAALYFKFYSARYKGCENLIIPARPSLPCCK